jgi:hypothetical protein
MTEQELDLLDRMARRLRNSQCFCTELVRRTPTEDNPDKFSPPTTCSRCTLLDEYDQLRPGKV